MAVPPRSYTIRMISCMAVVVITGPTIVYLKSLGTRGLFSTRFGMLLLMKMAAVLGLLAATVVLLWHTTVLLSRRYRVLASLLGREGDVELSTQDLRLFDGTEKRRALVAMDGKLYDVTGRDLWRKGIHPGGHRAGGDLTRALARAPHGKEVFERISPAGKLLERSPRAHTGPRWVFLLGIASSVVILTIVVLWRW
jgi:predicted heme/steroid binding protein